MKQKEPEQEISDQAAKIFEKIEKKKGLNHPLSDLRKLIDKEFAPLEAFNIQIAGTNGKGSVSKWLSLLFEKKGLKTGLFTSPHMLDHTERIQYSNKPISKKDFVEIYQQYESLFEKEGFTMFEIDLWIALVYFAREKVDIVLWEAGLGGRLDATSALLRDIAILTEIGLDHAEILGESIEQIAREKAGLMHDGNPEVVYSSFANASKESVYQVLSEKARDNHSELFFINLDLDVDTDVDADKDIIDLNEPAQETSESLTPALINCPWIKEKKQLNEMDQVMDLYKKLLSSSSLSQKAKRNLAGYQKDNFLLALSIFFDLGYELNEQEIEEVLSSFSWPGRMLFLQEKPVLLLDGAHNEPAIEALIDTIHVMVLKIERVYFSVLKDKSKKKMIAALLSKLSLKPEQLVLVDFQAQRQADLQELAREFHLAVIPLQTCLEEIFCARVNTLCCGSLYFIAELLKAAKEQGYRID